MRHIKRVTLQKAWDEYDANVLLALSDVLTAILPFVSNMLTAAFEAKSATAPQEEGKQ